MRVRIDPSADAIYIDLADREIVNSEEVSDGIIVDYDMDGKIIGVEILDAGKKAGESTIYDRLNVGNAEIGSRLGAKRRKPWCLVPEKHARLFSKRSSASLFYQSPPGTSELCSLCSWRAVIGAWGI